MVLDTIEILIGPGAKDLGAKEEIINSCWSNDPVHANLHTYFKLASNLINHFENRAKADVAIAKGRERIQKAKTRQPQ
jgi:hypothetical protein